MSTELERMPLPTLVDPERAAKVYQAWKTGGKEAMSKALEAPLNFNFMDNFQLLERANEANENGNLKEFIQRTNQGLTDGRYLEESESGTIFLKITPEQE